MGVQVTPSVARQILRRHGLHARRSLGQHFLVDPNTARRIVRIGGVGPDDTILEVGPGLGSLTVELAAAARSVVAVEIDARIAGALRETLADVRNVDVVVADALTAGLREVVPASSLLVANLPYNVATPILMRVVDDVPEIVRGVVMVQREVGERLVARAGASAYGSASVHLALLADAKLAGDVPPTVFLPRPKVDSVLVSFTRRHAPAAGVRDVTAFVRFVRDAFRHRRKTLRNALVTNGWDPNVVERALAEAGVDIRTRPEQLDIDGLARVFEAARRAA